MEPVRDAIVSGSKAARPGPEPRAGIAEHGEDPPFEAVAVVLPSLLPHPTRLPLGRMPDCFRLRFPDDFRQQVLR